jgi:hypothetical protein
MAHVITRRNASPNRVNEQIGAGRRATRCVCIQCAPELADLTQNGKASVSCVPRDTHTSFGLDFM